MSEMMKGIAKGIIAGAIAGTAVGVVVKSMSKPKSRLQKKTVHTLNTMGSVMQGVADMIDGR